jgi:hypothetical protein
LQQTCAIGIPLSTGWRLRFRGNTPQSVIQNSQRKSEGRGRYSRVEGSGLAPDPPRERNSSGLPGILPPGLLVGAQELVHILSRAYGVVPAAELFVGKEVELTHFRVWDLDSGGVVLRDEISADGEAGFRFGGSDEFEDLVDVGERFSSPVLADLAEQTVFDGIPFGSARGIVADGNGESERSAECVLKRFPPGASSRAVTSSAIRQNEEFAGGRVSLASLL